jgi:hypothetical protein
LGAFVKQVKADGVESYPSPEEETVTAGLVRVGELDFEAVDR